MSSRERVYLCSFVEKPQSEFQSECPVCLLVLREPYQVNCCGYAYCRVCIGRIQRESKPCPCCNDKRFDKFEDKRLKRSLNAFKVHCSNSQQGCQWVGELGQLDNHINTKFSYRDANSLKLNAFTALSSPYDLTFKPIKMTSVPRDFLCGYCKEFILNYEEAATNHWPVCGAFQYLAC